jgi:centractin
MIKAPIIIDNGSGVMKAGLGGDEKPTLNFNTYVGRPKHERIMLNANDQEIFIGSAAEKYKGLIKLSYPIEHGVV